MAMARQRGYRYVRLLLLQVGHNHRNPNLILLLHQRFKDKQFHGIKGGGKSRFIHIIFRRCRCRFSKSPRLLFFSVDFAPRQIPQFEADRRSRAGGYHYEFQKNLIYFSDKLLAAAPAAMRRDTAAAATSTLLSIFTPQNVNYTSSSAAAAWGEYVENVKKIMSCLLQFEVLFLLRLELSKRLAATRELVLLYHFWDRRRRRRES